MQFRAPNVVYDDRGGNRHVSVTLNSTKGDSVLVSFPDQEQPDETNAVERSRVIQRAKAILTAASQSL